MKALKLSRPQIAKLLALMAAEPKVETFQVYREFRSGFGFTTIAQAIDADGHIRHQTNLGK